MKRAFPVTLVLGLASTALWAQAGTGLDLSINGKNVTAKRAGLFDGRVRLVPAGKGTAESLFANATPTVLEAKIESSTPQGRGMVFSGAYTDGRIRVPFVRTMADDRSAVVVSETADFSGLPKDLAVAEYALVLPLLVAKDPHERMFAFGGEGRVEMFRQDCNDESHRAQSISDNRAFQPYWDIGRVLQLPTGYVVSRANHADTPAYPVDAGKSAPGWADYSETDRGVTVRVKDPAKSAPWAMMIDARKGEFTISPRPADQPPISGADYGKREFAFEMTLHEGSWPAAFPCELPPDVYRKLLAWLDQGKGYTHLAYACGNLGVGAVADKDALYADVIFRSRVQPSVLMRLFYREDAWRMSGIASALLGRSIPRNQPFETWEKIAQEVIEKLRKDGVPEAKP
jgi:hypothetical protein